ncbi:MAG: hypothetical protein KGS00_00210 [Alphaproteobacteria bacterium]|nr:hypothetical protein [Alphaproteobacteria bacterium]
MTDSVTPPPPVRPAPEECCRRGCCPCIFDYYWDALTRWEQVVRSLGLDPDLELARWTAQT